MSSILTNSLRDVIENKIHAAKSEVHGDMSQDVWDAIHSKHIAEDCITEIVSLLESWMFLPCCHVTGMHDPDHFESKSSICDIQKAEALERICKELGINPETKSKIDCGWCGEYIDKRKGEGMKLFPGT
jgi:hypothetical protein